MRDDFPKPVRDALAKRVGYCCSNPACRAPTIGPHSDNTKSVSVGKAAHITAAAPNGPRFDSNLTSEERTAATNGLWLCSNCATKIDLDVEAYPVSLLRQWKEASETEAELGLGRAVPIEQPIVGNDAVKLGELARTLLDVAKPHSLSLAFQNIDARVAATIKQMEGTPRWLADRSSERRRGLLTELADVQGRFLIIGPGGAGKSFALWSMASAMLGTVPHRLPLYLVAADFESAEDMAAFLEARALDHDCRHVLRERQVTIFLDGWSEFPRTPGPHDESERRRASALFARHTIIATGRRAREDDASFDIRDLEPLAGGGTGAPLAEQLPLVAVLSLLLGETGMRGMLLKRLHDHLAREAPSRSHLLDMMSRSAAEFAAEALPTVERYFRAVERHGGNDVSRTTIERMGVFREERGYLRPFHDLYWEWLVGRGLLLSNEPLSMTAATRLSLRDGLALALESGATTSDEQVDAACDVDLTLAALLASGCHSSSSITKVAELVRSGLSAAEPDARFRALKAALRLADDSLFVLALKALPATAKAAGSFSSSATAAIDCDRLWKVREELASALDEVEVRAIVLDVISQRGDSRWVAWLQEHVERFGLAEASGAALACSRELPVWCARLDNPIFGEKSYFLRAAAKRGANAPVADWVLDHLADLQLNPNGSAFYNLGGLVARCATPEALRRSLAAERIDALTDSALSVLSFACERLGAYWTGRLQVALFGLTPPRGAAFAMQTAGEITLDEARAWTRSDAAGIQELGWRALARIGGSALIPEVVSALPQSFGNVGQIPPLAALSAFDVLPEALQADLFARLNRPATDGTRSTIMPRAFEEFIAAVAKVKPSGVPSVIGLVLHKPEMFDGCQLQRFLPKWLQWERDTGLEIRADSQDGPPAWSRVLYTRLKNTPDAPFLLDRAIRSVGTSIGTAEICELAATGDATALRMLKANGVARFHARLFESRLLAQDFDAIMAIFGKVLDTFPPNALVEVARLTSNNLSRVDRLLAACSSIGNVPAAAIEILFTQALVELNVHRRHHLALLLAAQDTALTRELVMREERMEVRMLLSECEEVREQKLVDEHQQWIGAGSTCTAPEVPHADQDDALPVLEETVLVTLHQESPVDPLPVTELARALEVDDATCWKTLEKLETRALVRGFDSGPGRSISRATSLTEAGTALAWTLAAPPPLGHVGEFSADLSEADKAAIDAVAQRELRFGETSVSTQEIRTRMKQQCGLAPGEATKRIEALTGSYLLPCGPDAYRLSLRGLVASSWGTNAVHVIDAMLDTLRRLLDADPSVQCCTWATLRNAAGITARAQSLAYVCVKLAGLGQGFIMVGPGRGQRAWRVPSKDLDILLDGAGAGIDYVRAQISQPQVTAKEPLAVALPDESTSHAQPDRWDETWHRLLEWTNGQARSERLAAQILLSEGYTDMDPSHPLGGPDGGKDALCRKEGKVYVMAVFFPRGPQSVAAVRKKLQEDLRGVQANGANGIVFVTNQELSLSERDALSTAAASVELHLFHLERLTAILDQPAMASVRKQFLGIDFGGRPRG